MTKYCSLLCEVMSVLRQKALQVKALTNIPVRPIAGLSDTSHVQNTGCWSYVISKSKYSTTFLTDETWVRNLE